MSATSCASSSLGGSIASASFSRVSGVRRSCDTPASISVRCARKRRMRSCMRLKAVAAWRTSAAPSGRNLADVAAHAERLGGRGQAADRAHLVAHEQRRDAEQQQRRADHPGDEQVDRAGVKPLARRLDVQHAVRQLHAGSAPIAGRTSQSMVNGSRSFSRQRRARSSSIGPSTFAQAVCPEHRARLDAHLEIELFGAPGAGSSPGPRVREASHQLDGCRRSRRRRCRRSGATRCRDGCRRRSAAPPPAAAPAAAESSAGCGRARSAAASA